ncbi:MULTISPECIES: MFS transporter [Rhizobium]|jgi:predicted MFS family arabinose efflux permease|uniref:Predicted arabinose efflux permease, MFS family n=1 Tax=Rhizobium lusitanum TaxID=293958 RepID=A0A1C3XHU8_9HYPH|nr:MFS transporter [Rhizobium lusitanum]SCB51735.1 Predicted arabinose efflux permease, MFS family [Rhizobium lusitanum]
MIRTNRAAVILLIASGVAAGMQFAKVAVIFDEIRAAYHMGTAATGFLVSSPGLLGVVLGATAGRLCGRIGFRRALCLCLILGSCCSFFQALMPPLLPLLLSRIVEGLSHLGIIVCAPVLLLSTTAERSQAVVMGVWGSFFGVAFFILGSIGVAFARSFGITDLFLLHGALMLLLALVVPIFLDADQTPPRNTQFPGFASHILGETVETYRSPSTRLPAFIFLFYTFTYVALVIFAPHVSGDADQIALLRSLLPLAGIAGSVTSGVSAKLTKAPTTLAMTAYLAVSFMAVLVFVLGIGDLTLAGALGMMWCLGIAQGSAFTAIPYLAETRQQRGRAVGAIAQLGNLGSTIGAPCFAAMFGGFGIRGVGSLVVFTCLAGALVAWSGTRYLRRRTRRRPHTQPFSAS